MSQKSSAPVRVIWSCSHTGPLVEAHALEVIRHAAREGVSGVELAMMAIDNYLDFPSYPALADATSTPEVRRAHQQMFQNICDEADRHNLRLGVWHHEVWGPDNLLDLVPGIKAADGLLDLDSPALYQLIRDKLTEFFTRYPRVDEIVLTMTETTFPIAHRPFCEIPVPERIRRVIQAMADVTDAMGKHLVIRPFSAIRADELHVRQAVNELKADNVSMMYKTEPFDWHPYIENEPLIGSVTRYEARAEVDSGAEYYGQGAFPAAYTQHLKHRLTAALEKGATTAVVRVDRGAQFPALGHPINEVNVVAITRWLMDPSRSLEDHWDQWFASKHGQPLPATRPLLEKTFDVIRDALYIDQHALSHHRMPTLAHLKHIQVFGLLEEEVPLDHMSANWGVIASRTTPTHEEILEQKQRAVDLAQELNVQLAAMRSDLPADAYARLQEYLTRLPLLARACQHLTKLLIMHVREVWPLPETIEGSFDEEAGHLLKVADEIETRFGAEFFARMPACMRDVVNGLREERRLEIPLREKIEQLPRLRDYVLCGFASEAHRLSKWLHSGKTFPFQDRYVRATGDGEHKGFTYHLSNPQTFPCRLIVTLANDGTKRPFRLTAAGKVFDVKDNAFKGLREMTFNLPPTTGDLLPVRFTSLSPEPVWVSTISLHF